MSECCQHEIEILLARNKKLAEEEKRLKRKYQDLLVENLQKDVIIQSLKEQIVESAYLNYKDKLSVACIENLRSVGKSQREDSQFIAIILAELYVDLHKKTLSNSHKSSDSSAISPSDLQMLQSIFDERLSHIPEEISDLRKKSLPKLIRNAIDNARRRNINNAW